MKYLKKIVYKNNYKIIYMTKNKLTLKINKKIFRMILFKM